ncbi:ATP-binding protein [Cloacibacillus evryensis]|uniref:ATP-binding protein n=1 Tax=Cloacibacillus evryensis TaxID=508460 RepID=UPI0022DEB05D|nr:ATP-binding protein [Cloacibacillus evryensis]
MIPDYSKAEDSAIEFKEALEEKKVRSWLKSVSAFANTCGGSGTDTPYFYTSDGNNIAYVRQGNQSIPCPRHMLMSLTLKGQNRTYDSYPSAYKSNELSFLALAASYKIKTATDFEPERDLVSFGLLDYRSGFLTNAGVLFSDQAPYRHSSVFCTRWNGSTKGTIGDDALDDKEYYGNLLYLLENAETFVKNNSKNKWSIMGMTREERPDYPQAAVREALINALMHRDYQIIGSEIHIDMYDDRLEITSPGGMPEGHLIQELDLNHVPSLRRNIIISDLFHRMHLMERRGSGITRILRAYERMGRKPLFYSESSYFTVMMPNVNYIDKRQNDSFDDADQRNREWLIADKAGPSQGRVRAESGPSQDLISCK